MTRVSSGHDAGADAHIGAVESAINQPSPTHQSPSARTNIALPSRAGTPVSPSLRPLSLDATQALRDMASGKTSPIDKRKADAADDMEDTRPVRKTRAVAEAGRRLSANPQANDDLPDEEESDGVVLLTEQSAIAYPAGHRDVEAEPSAPVTDVGPVGKGKTKEIDPPARPPLPPRSLLPEVLNRLPFRDKDDPELLDKLYAVLNEDGTVDQTRCDEAWECRGVIFDSQFGGMMKRLRGAVGHEEHLLRLQEQGKSDMAAMIHNGVSSSQKRYQSTELKRSHCQSTRQWNKLNEGKLKNKEEPVRGVTLNDYDRQEPWTIATICARIPVPPGEVKSYKARLGESAFDDFAVTMPIAPSTVEGSMTQPGTWHAGLYGCGVAQFFNGAMPDEDFHIVFANTLFVMWHPRRGRHLEPAPTAIQIKTVPLKKQLLAWYGKGWFESRPQFHYILPSDDINADNQQINFDRRLGDLNAGDRSILSKMKTALYSIHNRRISWHLNRRDQELLEARAYLGPALKFVERINSSKQSLEEWVQNHDTGIGTSDEKRVRTLAQAATDVITVSSPSGGAQSQSASQADPSRLEPLMQQFLGLRVQMAAGQPLGSGLLRVRVDSIVHPDNRLELIQLKATCEAQISRIRAMPSEFRRRVKKIQKSIIDPTNRLLAWFGDRSAR
ncbi:MAG: hypothetical protein ABW032_09695, partial [Burkholderiaceae bacterium]